MFTEDPLTPFTDEAILVRTTDDRCDGLGAVNEAGSEKVMEYPPPTRAKSSMVSAWAVRGRISAATRRTVKRALLIEEFPL